jgi:hypothetical protein
VERQEVQALEVQLMDQAVVEPGSMEVLTLVAVAAITETLAEIQPDQTIPAVAEVAQEPPVQMLQ